MSVPATQSYMPIEMQGVCMATTTQGMDADRAPSIAAAVQL